MTFGKCSTCGIHHPSHHSCAHFANPVMESDSTCEAFKTSHDDHYKALEARGIVVIEEMEAVMVMFFPECQERAKMALCMAIAKKYELRSGTKDRIEKEFDKMRNYEFRSLNGRWPWDVAK